MNSADLVKLVEKVASIHGYTKERVVNEKFDPTNLSETWLLVEMVGGQTGPDEYEESMIWEIKITCCWGTEIRLQNVDIVWSWLDSSEVDEYFMKKLEKVIMDGDWTIAKRLSQWAVKPIQKLEETNQVYEQYLKEKALWEEAESEISGWK